MGARQFDHRSGGGDLGDAAGFGVLLRLENGADFFGAGEILGFGFGPDEVSGPIHQEHQQAQFDQQDGAGQQPSRGLQEARTGAEPPVGGDDVLESDEGPADGQQIVVDEPDRVEHGFAVALHGMVGREADEADPFAAFF